MNRCPPQLPTLPVQNTELAENMPRDAVSRIPQATRSYYEPERPEPDVCVFCAQEAPGCLCPCPARPTPVELDHDRQARLTRAEIRSQQCRG
jgi:hypothetical protein